MPSDPKTTRLLAELRERGFGDAAYEIERLRGAAEHDGDSGLVQKLRDAFHRIRYEGDGPYMPDGDLFDAAADEIERLRSANASLREGEQTDETRRAKIR